jgi:hypothetical protein
MAGTAAKARLGAPSGSRGMRRRGWGVRASAVAGAHVRVWVRAGAHGRGNLPDAPLGSGLAARRRGGATRPGVQAITGGLTAAVSLATHTREDGVARLGRTTMSWSEVEKVQPRPRTVSTRMPAHWDVL